MVFPSWFSQVTDPKAASRHGVSAADVPALVYYEHEIPHVFAGDPEEPSLVLQGTLAYDVCNNFGYLTGIDVQGDATVQQLTCVYFFLVMDPSIWLSFKNYDIS